MRSVHSSNLPGLPIRTFQEFEELFEQLENSDSPLENML